MRSKFKKMLTYFLLSAIILPGWVLGSSLFQKTEKAYAATFSVQDVDDSELAPNFTLKDGSHWDAEVAGNLDSSQTTNGNFAGEWARWKFHASDSGRYMIMVSWLASADRATNAAYSLLDNTLTLKNDIDGVGNFSIDQTRNASGGTVGVPTWSGYYPLSIFDLTAGNDYYVNLSGVNANKVNADSLMITYDGLDPSNPTISINSGATYSNSQNVNLSLSAEDNMAVALMQISETNPIPAATAFQAYQTTKNFTLSAGDGPKTVYVQYYDVVFNVSTVASDSIILDTTVAVPTNVTASLAGNVITVDWDDVVDGGSGLSGYNIYSSSDGFANKINPSLIPAGTSAFGDTIYTNGTYSYKVEAVDNAGNISAKSAETTPAIVANITPASPTNVATEVSDHNLTIFWDAVGGGVTGYIVTINGVSRDVGNVLEYPTSLEYGTYKVIVTSYYSINSFGINDPAGLNEAKNVAIAAGLEKSVTLSSAVKISTVSAVTVAPEVAEAAPVTPAVTTPSQTDTSDTGLETEEEGQIKGEEESTEEADENINWTPWIILFVLIILAGAATGGYFYWFAGEEEVETKVTTKPEPESKSTTKSSSKSSSGKKPRRW